MNRRLLAVMLSAGCLVGGVLVTPGLAQANPADRFLRGLYSDPIRFAQLDGAAQSNLERKFGFKGAHTPGTLPASAGSPLAGGFAVNDNAADTTAQDTQSETTLVALGGKAVVVGYNDSGSCLPSCGSTPASDHFTGYARSTDGGRTFTDLGKLPNSSVGDAGDPQLAVDRTNKVVYFAALGFNVFNQLPVFKSIDGGITFGPPVNATPGWSASNEQDKDWMTVDNAPGPGQGTVFVSWTRFGSSTDIRLTHSIDGGATFVPNQGVLIASGTVQGSFVAVGPDHAVYVFWLNGSGSPQKIQMRKSTDGGVTFAPPVTVATLGVTGINGDLGLGGGFRTNAFPHVGINPKSGQLYVVYNDNPAGPDQGDIEFTTSTDGTAWTTPVRVNDDATTRDQFMPTVTTSADGRHVFATWYDRRNDPSNSLIDRYGAIGDIAGGVVTFRPNVRFTTASFPVVIGQDPVINTTYMGDYDQAVSVKNRFIFTWGDNSLPSAAHTHQPDVRFSGINF